MTEADDWEDVPPPDTPRDRWGYLVRFVGVHWERFESAAEALKAGRSTLSWSWSACLFGDLWLVYRRRYAWGMLFWLAWLMAFVVFGRDLAKLIAIGGRVALGAWGKSLYLRAGLAQVDAIVSNTPDEAVRLKRIDFAGGTSSNAVIVFILLEVALGEVWLGISRYVWPALPSFQFN